jgi:hypothetical protein
MDLVTATVDEVEKQQQEQEGDSEAEQIAKVLSQLSPDFVFVDAA